MDVHSSIKRILKSLNSTWFEALMKEFNTLPGGHIEIEELKYGYDARTDEEFEETTTKQVELTIEKYAWNGFTSYLPEEVIKGKDVLAKIKVVIKKELQFLPILSDKCQYLTSVVNCIFSIISEKIAKANDQQVERVLNYLSARMIFEIEAQYHTLLALYFESATQEDKLPFALKQKKLAFLLRLLVEAGFVEESLFYSPYFQQFTSKYFFCYNQKKAEKYVRFNGRKEIDKVKNYRAGEYQKIKKEVEEELAVALRKL
jgi:hypothetical protein